SFGLDGFYGHPDHIAISQLASAALVAAADPGYAAGSMPQHRVLKFYHLICSERIARGFTSVFGEISMVVNGVRRGLVVWPDWAVTTRIDGDAYTKTAIQAIHCHRSQMPSLPGIDHLSDAQAVEIQGEVAFARAFSLVDSGSAPETDLFAGIEEI